MWLPRVSFLLKSRFLGSAAHALLPHAIISEVDGTWRLNEPCLFCLRGSSSGASGGRQQPVIADMAWPEWEVCRRSRPHSSGDQG